MATWKCFSLDVWGDGTADNDWTVNDRREAGTVEFDEDADDAAIVKAMQDAGIMANPCTVPLNIDGYYGLLFIEHADTMEPYFQLERQ